MLLFIYFVFFPLVLCIDYCIKETYRLQNACLPLPTSIQTNSSPLPTRPFSSFEEWQQKDTRRPRKPKGIGQQVVDSIDGGLSDDLGAIIENYMSPQRSNNVYEKTKRFNYASVDCAATVRKSNKEAKGMQSILIESKDQYLLNRCSSDKFVIINLCEQIRVDTIVMANFEFFSSTFRDFKVYGAAKYPTEDWSLLGQWQAKNTRDLQVFRVPESPWTNYIKIEFLTHYGHEYYCPLSLVRVHGMSMMELYTNIESNDEIIENTVDHLWPAEIREQIIQPQPNIINASESFPIKIEEEPETAIPPIEEPTNETADIEASHALIIKPNTCAQENTLLLDPVQTTHVNRSIALTTAISHTSTPEATATNITEDHRPMITHKVHSKETQESIYKTIMKRLNVLEHNMTLSQRFLDEQNKVLNDVFVGMEKKHQEQLMMLIEHLNGTASQKMEIMKKRYERWHADMKEQTENGMKDMSLKINIMADQLSFEKRVSQIQSVVIIILFVYMALSSGTLNTLSPVIAAQSEERKKQKEKRMNLHIDTNRLETEPNQQVPNLNTA
ncbi:UNC-like C-terminal-domain-containing protein [Sporodiniella umbellata]|nr:UNC-like C-terminal-domain-containing protein [Sporodiniella umbellata]